MVEPVESLGKAIKSFKEFVGKGQNCDVHSNLQVIATSAKDIPGNPRLSFKEARKRLNEHNVLLVFGTGFGLSSEIFNICNACLEPIRGYGVEDYRHLSVRSAVGVCLDRLRGPC